MWGERWILKCMLFPLLWHFPNPLRLFLHLQRPLWPPISTCSFPVNLLFFKLMTLKSYKFAVPSGFPPSNKLSDRSRECSPLKYIIQMAILHKGHIPRVSVSLPFQSKRGRHLLILKLLAVQYLNIQLLLTEIALDQSRAPSMKIWLTQEPAN